MKNEKEKKNIEFISILNKIKHKPLIIQNIFPFLDNRPFILPCLLDKDINLSQELNKIYKSVKKNSDLSSQINPNIYKFVTYKLLYQIPSSEIEKEDDEDDLNLNILYDNEDNNDKNEYNLKDNLNFYFSLNNFISFVKKSFEKKIIPDNINIKKDLLNKYLPEGNAMNNFIKDYISQNNILYIPYPQDDNYIYLIDKIIKYLIKNNKNNDIKRIIFDELYSFESLEIFVKNANKIKNINFPSLEFIKLKNNINNLKNIKIKYKLNQLFSSDSLLGLTIISNKDIKNILNSNETEENKLKIKYQKKSEVLYIDLENLSPYNKYFYFLFEKYFNNNKDIQIIIIDNFDILENTDFKIEKNRKIHFPKLKNIYYENYQEKSQGQKVKEFINIFFDINNLFYLNEGYNNKYDLNYINYSNEIDFDLIKKLNNNNISQIIIEYEKIKITYNKAINKLKIKNESSSKKLNKNFFNDFMKFYDILYSYYENISYNIQESLLKKIIFEKIKRNSNIITKSTLCILSKYLNFLEYYPYSVPMDYLINYYFNKKLLLVIKTACNHNFYLNINNGKGSLLKIKKYDDIYSCKDKKIKKEIEGQILCIKIGKNCILKFDENNYLKRIIFLNNSSYYLLSEHDYTVDKAELYELDKYK